MYNKVLELIKETDYEVNIIPPGKNSSFYVVRVGSRSQNYKAKWVIHREQTGTDNDELLFAVKECIDIIEEFGGNNE